MDRQELGAPITHLTVEIERYDTGVRRLTNGDNCEKAKSCRTAGIVGWRISPAYRDAADSALLGWNVRGI